MNNTYAYDTRNTSCIVINRIYSLLESRGWSVKTLSDKSNIPYETLKKLLNRKIENTSIHNIIKIATAFHCQIDYLVGDDNASPKNFSPSLHTQAALDYFDNIDSSCQFNASICSHNYIPVYHPHSFVQNSFPQEPSFDVLDTAGFPTPLNSIIECGIVISSHCYHPIYYYGDILLIARDRFPHCREISLFVHHGNLYIRKFYSYSNTIVLEPVNDIGTPIVITDLSSWSFWGYVAGIYRTQSSKPLLFP